MSQKTISVVFVFIASFVAVDAVFAAQQQESRWLCSLVDEMEFGFTKDGSFSNKNTGSHNFMLILKVGVTESTTPSSSYQMSFESGFLTCSSISQNGISCLANYFYLYLNTHTNQGSLARFELETPSIPGNIKVSPLTCNSLSEN